MMVASGSVPGSASDLCWPFFDCRTGQSLSEEGEEGGEVERSGGLLDHGIDLRVRSDLSHHGIEIFQVVLKVENKA